MQIQNRREFSLRNYMAVIAFVIVFALASLITPNWLRWMTINNMLVQGASVALIAMGMTVVISSGNIDISLGSQIGLSGTVFALLIRAGIGLVPAVLLTVLVGVLSGIFSGYIIAKFNVLPMVMTMAMMYMLRGISRVISGGDRVYIQGKQLMALSYYKIGGVFPQQALVVLIMFLILYFIVRKTRFGMLVEAVGDNKTAAQTAGIPVIVMLVACYVISGLMGSLGGITESIRTSGSDPATLGLDFEGDAVAATVLGGTPMSGGRANIVGTLFGAYLLQMVKMLVNMNNIPFAFSNVLKGIIIVVAVWSQTLEMKKRKEGH